MRLVFLDCSDGLSCERLASALWECIPDRDKLESAVESLGIRGVRLVVSTVSSHQFSGTRLAFSIPENAGSPITEHTTLSELTEFLNHLVLSEECKKDTIAIFQKLIEAKSGIYDQPPEEIPLGESGTLETVLYIITITMQLEQLSFDRFFSSPVNTGFGKIRNASTVRPIPSPLTLSLLSGAALYSDSRNRELCDETASAVLAHYADGYINFPELELLHSGYGFGHDYPTTGEYLHILYGETGEVAEVDRSPLTSPREKKQFHPATHSSYEKRSIIKRMDQSIDRLKKIKQMNDEGAPAGDLLNELIAIRSSVRGISNAIIKNHFYYSIDYAIHAEDSRREEKLIGLIDKFIK